MLRAPLVETASAFKKQKSVPLSLERRTPLSHAWQISGDLLVDVRTQKESVRHPFGE
jgi:hypothetical protein